MSNAFIKVGASGKVDVDEFGHLNLHNMGISDISEIKGLNKLTSLEVLWFNDNQISEIKGLDKLINLQVLYFGGNQISEIKGLDKLINLQVLYFGGNQITEIKGLDKLTSLQELELGGNQISKRILRECGGLSNYGMAKDPQKFVEYCSQRI